MEVNEIDSHTTTQVEKVWRPNKRGQEEVLRAPTSIFEIMGGGAAGGGKTDLAVLEPVVRGWTEHPKFKDLMLRRTFPDLDKEIVPRQKEWYEPLGAVYNETKKLWTWPSGAKTQNGHAEREDDVRKYDTAEYNRICWEEGTHFTGFQYLYLSLSRCRSSSPDLPAVIRIYTNPGNVGHGFQKKRFIDPYPNGRKLLKDKITGQTRMYIPFRGSDNPHLLVNDPNYLKRLEGLPEQERRAKLLGDWSAYEGQVFSEFRIIHLPDEPENALHVIEPFDIPSWWPRFIAIDWGFAAMTFVIWAAVSPSGRCYIYRTASWTGTTINIWVPEVVGLSEKESLEEIVICHSAGQHRGEPLTIQKQVQEAFGDKFPVILGERDRIAGKNLIHEFLRWKQKPKANLNELPYDPVTAANILRRFGEMKYNEYMQMFLPTPEETNLPKLQIFTHDPKSGLKNNELIDVIPACVPDENNIEDVKEFKGDDPYDALRMILHRVNRYIDQSVEAQKFQQRLEQLYARNQPTSEAQTAFYRELERIEDENSEVFQIRRRRALGNHRFRVR